MPSLGAPELVIVLFIALVLFGAGKLADAGKSVGQGIREFRRAVHEEPAPTAAASEPRRCLHCRAEIRDGDPFCPACGQSTTPATGG